jgi:hypothetical protein
LVASLNYFQVQDPTWVGTYKFYLQTTDNRPAAAGGPNVKYSALLQFIVGCDADSQKFDNSLIKIKNAANLNSLIPSDPSKLSFEVEGIIN